jgi:hypothetical protein
MGRSAIARIFTSRGSAGTPCALPLRTAASRMHCSDITEQKRGEETVRLTSDELKRRLADLEAESELNEGSRFWFELPQVN